MLLGGILRTQREVTRLEEENDQLRRANDKLTYALDTERKTLNETAAAGRVTNQLIAALTSVATAKPLPPASPAGEHTAGEAAP